MRLPRSEEHTSELQSLRHLVCRLLLEKKGITIMRGREADPRQHPGLLALDQAQLRERLTKYAPVDIVFFFNDTATTEIYTLSLHDALPIYTYSKDWFDHPIDSTSFKQPGG